MAIIPRRANLPPAVTSTTHWLMTKRQDLHAVESIGIHADDAQNDTQLANSATGTADPFDHLQNGHLRHRVESKPVKQLLTRQFFGRPIILFLDSDAQDDSLKAQRALRMAKSAAGDKSSVLMAELPRGRQDVGDCTPGEALNCFAKRRWASRCVSLVFSRRSSSR